MNYILTLNLGSSSLKATVFTLDDLTEVHSVYYENLKDPTKHLIKLLSEIKTYLPNIQAVAHRVVHGGDFFFEPTLITKTVENKIQKLAHLAPLHNPKNLLGIRFFKTKIKKPHFAIFDTAFFHTLPPKSFLYAIPYKYYLDNQIRKYGFHGINHHYAYRESSRQLNFKRASGIICHLGNGCSISAIKKGKPIDTSMGFTPLDGAIMGTRCGQIDPGVLLYLQKQYPSLNLEKLLTEKSGLLGLSQISSHLREIYLEAKTGNKQCQIAIDTFAYKIASFVGFYANLLDEIDFLTFTGTIGQKAPYIRKKVLLNLPGLVLDPSQILVIPANENLQMATYLKQSIKHK